MYSAKEAVNKVCILWITNLIFKNSKDKVSLLWTSLIKIYHFIKIKARYFLGIRSSLYQEDIKVYLKWISQVISKIKLLLNLNKRNKMNFEMIH